MQPGLRLPSGEEIVAGARLGLLLALMPFLVAGEGVAHSTIDFDDLHVEFEIVPPVGLVGMPLLLRVAIENRTERMVTVDLGPHQERAYQFSLVDSNGLVTRGEWILRGGPGRVGRVHLGSGSKYDHILIVNRWLALEAPGDYMLVVDLNANVFLGKEEMPQVLDSTALGRLEKRTVLALEVVHDEIAAKRICGALAIDAKHPHGKVSDPAMEALTFVRSPICIVDLLDVVQNASRPFHQDLLGALAAIGGRAAAEALVELADEITAEHLPMILYFLDGFCDEYEQIVSPALLRARGRGCH